MQRHKVTLRQVFTVLALIMLGIGVLTWEGQSGHVANAHWKHYTADVQQRSNIMMERVAKDRMELYSTAFKALSYFDESMLDIMRGNRDRAVNAIREGITALKQVRVKLQVISTSLQRQKAFSKDHKLDPQFKRALAEVGINDPYQIFDNSVKRMSQIESKIDSFIAKRDELLNVAAKGDVRENMAYMREEIQGQDFVKAILDDLQSAMETSSKTWQALKLAEE